MVRQISFDFGFVEQLHEQDFIVSSCNQHAYEYIQSWPEWPSQQLIIYGPHSSGKTHLAQIWQEHTKATLLKRQNLYSQDPLDKLQPNYAYIIEDIEQVHDETALLHWFNVAKERRAYLMLTAKCHPANLGVRLPDLRSRLIATPAIGVGLPDEELLKTLFVKHFSDRQLRVNPVVIDFLISRTERSFSFVRYLVDRLDKQALIEHKSITVPFAKKVLSTLPPRNSVDSDAQR